MTEITVCLTFDFDAESVQIRKEEEPGRISKGHFAVRRGMPRILSLLEKYEIPATFFVCGWVVEQYPESIKKINEGGHELAAHGYLHEELDKLSIAQEKEVHEKTFQALENVGVDVKGFRAPYWKLSNYTLEIISEKGCIYDSSLMADDRPYLFQLEEDSPKIVEFPVEWFLDDWILFEEELKPPSQILETWKNQFDALRTIEDIPEDYRVFTLTMHPACIGHAYRLAILEKLIEYMKSKGAQFSRMKDLAEKFLEEEKD